MLRDREGHAVEICGEGNKHILVYGSSGQGKTYFLCRLLEKYCEQKKRVLILDYSGSYTDEELLDKGFMNYKQAKHYDVYVRGLPWVYLTKGEEEFLNDIADALLEVLRCNSYFQRKLLTEALTYTMEREKKITIPGILVSLEKMLIEEEGEEKNCGNIENLNRLLTRLYPYRDIINFEILNKYTEISVKKPVTIIDLTFFPENQRRFLTELIMSILWREVYRQENRNRCDILLLDEMQFIPVDDGSTLSMMLREGRKREFSLVLSTQFLCNYSEAEKSALMQADTKVIFHPTPEDMKYSARIIDPVHPQAGEKILDSLWKGEALLKGYYQLDNRRRVASMPIVIKAEKSKEIDVK